MLIEGILIVFVLLAIAFFAFIVTGLGFISNAVFKNNNIILTNTNYNIAKLSIIMVWLSLPLTIFNLVESLISISYSSATMLLIVLLGVLAFSGIILYGMSELSIILFQQNGVYINNIYENLQINNTPTSSPTSSPASSPASPEKKYVYNNNFIFQITTIFAWFSILYNLYLIILILQ